MVMPGIAVGALKAVEEPQHRAEEHKGSGGNGGGGSDPLIGALIQKLPKTGDQWSADERITWLQMIAMAFQMTYGPAEAIEIKKKDA